MRRLVIIVALVVGCSSSGEQRSDTGIDSLATAPETGTPSATAASAASGDTTDSAEATAATAADESADEAPKLDIVFPDLAGADDTGGAVPPSCENIEDFPKTSVGCEFWAAQVPSSGSALPYGISVGNPGNAVANIVIEDMRGPGNTLRVITSLQLDPTESEMVPINGQGGLLPGETHVVASVGATDLGALRVTADVPITAMQIFPVGGGPSHVAEASLLLPTNALDTSYIAVGYPHFAGSAGWIVVVGTVDGTTVTTTGGDVVLDAFDVWTYNHGSDATGFFVGADQPVAVFSGTECTMIPGLPWYACDHIEEQVVPLASWGELYVAPRHPHRVPTINATPEPVYWRIIGAADDMSITLQPPVAGVAGVVDLAAIGDFYEFSTPDSFTAQSDEPFMLVQYMSGCYNVIVDTADPNNCSQGPTGDPYMIQVTPVEQWLTSLPFLTDTSYPRDFVMLMREAGTTVSLECLGIVDDTHFTAIPGTIYEVGWVDLDIAGTGGEGTCFDGEQFLTADAPVGVLVGGVDWATSYGYPGGMSLGSLWTPPTEPPG